MPRIWRALPCSNVGSAPRAPSPVTAPVTARRSGFTLVEALVTLLLLLLLLQAASTLVSAMARAAAALADRAESLAAARATAWIIQEEVEGARACLDVSVPEGDSVSVRAFRGTAFVCAAIPPRDLIVRWSGLRAPDPTKDSALVLLASARWTEAELAARAPAPGGCGDAEGGREERWTIAEPLPDALVLHLFERWSYHLVNEALRLPDRLRGPAAAHPCPHGPGAERAERPDAQPTGADGRHAREPAGCGGTAVAALVSTRRRMVTGAPVIGAW